MSENLQISNFQNSVTLGKQSLSSLTRVGNGRRTVDTLSDVSPRSNRLYAQRTDPASSWRTLQLQRNQLLSLSSARLTQIAKDLSPQINKAIWDWLLFCNPGFVIESESSRAESVADEFIEKLDDYNGYIGALWDSCFSSILFGGAFFLELVLDDGGRSAEDLVVLDPATALFRRVSGGPRGQRWQLGQRIRGRGFVPMEFPTISYVPFKKEPDQPYGDPVVGSAIYASVFLLGLVQDLRRVVANQGFSRQDYEVNTELLLQLLTYVDPGVTDTDTKVSEFLDEHLQQIRDQLEKLDVDSDYVHPDLVKVNYATGGVVASNLAGVDTLVRMLERQVTNGAASIPILMADNQSLAETQASRQVENYVSQVMSVQERLSHVLSRLLNFALRARGVRGEVTFKFKRQRYLDDQTVAETESLKVASILDQEAAGVIDAIEARRQIDELRDPLLV